MQKYIRHWYVIVADEGPVSERKFNKLLDFDRDRKCWVSDFRAVDLREACVQLRLPEFHTVHLDYKKNILT